MTTDPQTHRPTDAGTDYVTEFLRLVASRAPVGRADVTSKPVLRAVRAAG